MCKNTFCSFKYPGNSFVWIRWTKCSRNYPIWRAATTKYTEYISHRVIQAYQTIRKTHIYFRNHKMRTLSSHLLHIKSECRGMWKMSDYTESIWNCKQCWQSRQPVLIRCINAKRMYCNVSHKLKQSYAQRLGCILIRKSSTEPL